MTSTSTAAPSAPRTSLPTVPLVLLAILGDATWRLAMLLPWALPMAIGILGWGQAWMWALYVPLMLLLAWTLSPRSTLAGTEITRPEAPALFAELAGLQSALRAPCVHRVLLDDSFNAGAHESGPPWRRRRTLLLGLPLLAVLTPEQARAVVAHELGHFSRRHGPVGQWLYRARRGWLQWAGLGDAGDSAFNRGVAVLARDFGHWFAALSWAHARRCEFEADAMAAEVVSARDLVAALWVLSTLDRRHEQLNRLVRPVWTLASAQVPQDWWSRVTQQVMDRPLDDDELARATHRPTAPEDSHPSLPDRAVALGVLQADAAAPRGWPKTCAGQLWLADWPGQLRRACEQWAHDAQVDWPLQHTLMCDWAQRVSGDGHSPEAPWRQARWLQALGRHDDALAGLEAAHAAAGEPDVNLNLALAQAWLTADSTKADHPAQALALLEATVKQAPAAAWRARLLALDQAHRDRDEAALARLEALFGQAQLRRSQAAEVIWRELSLGRCLPSGMAPADQRLLAAALNRLPAVQAAWWCSAQAASRDGRHYTAQVMVVQVDPAALQQVAGDESGILGPLRWVMDQLVPSLTDMLLLRLIYTAEVQTAQTLSGSPATAWRRTGSDHMSSASAPGSVGGVSKP